MARKPSEYAFLLIRHADRWEDRPTLFAFQSADELAGMLAYAARLVVDAYGPAELHRWQCRVYLGGLDDEGMLDGSYDDWLVDYAK